MRYARSSISSARVSHINIFTATDLLFLQWNSQGVLKKMKHNTLGETFLQNWEHTHPRLITVGILCFINKALRDYLIHSRGTIQFPV